MLSLFHMYSVCATVLWRFARCCPYPTCTLFVQQYCGDFARCCPYPTCTLFVQEYCGDLLDAVPIPHVLCLCNSTVEIFRCCPYPTGTLFEQQVRRVMLKWTAALTVMTFKRSQRVWDAFRQGTASCRGRTAMGTASCIIGQL